MQKVKLFKCSIIFLIAIVACILQGCNASAPNEQKLKEDLSQYVDGDYSIDKINISKMQIDDNQAHYWISLALSNNEVYVTAETECYYEFYDRGGWLFDRIGNFNNKTYTPKCGYDENLAYERINESYKEYNIEFDSHQTTLESGYDVFTYKLSTSGNNFDANYIATLEYTFTSLGKWEESNLSVELSNVDFHPSGLYYAYQSGEYYSENLFFEITDYTDNTINLVSYDYIDLLNGGVGTVFSGNTLKIRHYTLDIKTNGEGLFTFDFYDGYEDNVYILANDSIYREDSYYIYTLSNKNSEYWKKIQDFDETKFKDNYYGDEDFYYYNYYSSRYTGSIPDNAVKIPEIYGKPVKDSVDNLKRVGLHNVTYDDSGDYLVGTIYTFAYSYDEFEIFPGDYVTSNSQVYLLS